MSDLGNRPLVIAGREFRSRLLAGTGKFSSNESMRAALLASGTEIVTVALRRVRESPALTRRLAKLEKESAKG